MWVPGSGGDPAGSSRRVGGAVNLRRTPSVNPVQGVGVLVSPEFALMFVDGLSQGLLDFDVAPVRELRGIDPRLLAKVVA